VANTPRKTASAAAPSSRRGTDGNLSRDAPSGRRESAALWVRGPLRRSVLKDCEPGGVDDPAAPVTDERGDPAAACCAPGDRTAVHRRRCAGAADPDRRGDGSEGELEPHRRASGGGYLTRGATERRSATYVPAPGGDGEGNTRRAARDVRRRRVRSDHEHTLTLRPKADAQRAFAPGQTRALRREENVNGSRHPAVLSRHVRG
jgi:hypothetical protein